MNREASATIKGFLYQFNVTLKELLTSSDDCSVTIEGIEDIDVSTPTKKKTIQCKYHESNNKFSISLIAKPILQMLLHYSKNQDSNIQYILYAHFPNEIEGVKKLEKSDINSIITTNNEELIAKYISKIKPPTKQEIIKLVDKPKKTKEDLATIKKYYLEEKDLKLNINIDNFLKNEKFKFIIGESFNSLVASTKHLFSKNTKLTTEDIEELFYPNAIQIIANKSTKNNIDERNIDKKSLIEELEKTKKVAISRWTKELKNYKKLLRNRRLSLTTGLNQNNRLRCFIFEADRIEDFDNNIVTFIVDYLNKYHHKISLHNKTPIFCIKTSNHDLIFSIQKRLHKKNISIETGYIGDVFFENAFMREPKKIIKDNWFEFKMRLCILTEHIIEILKDSEINDTFLIGKNLEPFFDWKDINIEYLDITSFNELKYLLLLSKEVEYHE